MELTAKAIARSKLTPKDLDKLHSKPLSDDDTERLDRNIYELTSKIDCSGPFMIMLVSNGVIDKEYHEYLTNRYYTSSERVYDIIMSLHRKSEYAYYQFLKTLTDSEQGHIVKMLDEYEVKKMW